VPLNEALQAISSDGWEIVSAVPIQDKALRHALYLKRQAT
jgi:hypothetical protein